MSSPYDETGRPRPADDGSWVGGPVPQPQPGAEPADPWAEDETRTDLDRGMWHINFTVPWNMTGQPAGTVDAGRTADGRTIGVQVVGRPFDDAGVLRLMGRLEQL